jgi:superfamily II DNA or RNA helicase
MDDTHRRESDAAEPVMAVPDGTPPPTQTEISLQGADLVLRTRLALAAVPALQGLVVRDTRRPHLYRARPCDLSAIMAVIGVRHPVRLTFDPAPPPGIQPHLRARPRPYQEEALAAWEAAGRRGVVVLPTGAGKTLLGALAIARALTRTLVLVPTIVLCAQWRDELLRLLDLPPGAVGIVGGGRREWTCPVVAATYDGAARALGRVPSFGLLVADEVHHLPADTYRTIAQAAVAPFRLGLSATLARSDGRERDLNDLLGGVVYTERPDALAAEGYLAPFDEVRLTVDLGAEDRAAYDRDMGVFRAYRERMARAREPALAFLERVRKRSTFDAAARAALLAYQRARTLALTSQAKIDALEELLARHADERCLIFAEHIDAVEAIGRAYLIPTITSRTPAAERATLTADFRAGRLTKIATGRVWNEGVDVPEACVAIVIAGTGMERETVQRLGRVLRPAPGKRAVLYELVTRDTAEEGVAERRRLRPVGAASSRPSTVAPRTALSGPSTAAPRSPLHEGGSVYGS